MKKQRLNKVAYCLFIFLIQSKVTAHAESFDAAFLSEGEGAEVDLSSFSRSDILPGKYIFDIFVNENYKANEEVIFKDNEAKVQPCISLQKLSSFGLDLTKISEKKLNQKSCFEYQQIKDLGVEVDTAKQTLSISIPQAYLNKDVRGYIDKSRWDNGITSAYMNYYLTGYYNSYHGDNANSVSANVLLGANFNEWRYRSNLFVSDFSDSPKLNITNNYLYKVIPSIESKIKIGELHSSGKIFSSNSYDGIQLATYDNLLPQSQRGFAPVIKGIAKSNALVTVKQGGNTIYKTSVQPGPFEIDDLYSTGSSGDLHIEIKEEDNSISSFIVPYSSLPSLQRAGHIGYEVNVGKLKNTEHLSDGLFLDSNTYYGLNNTFTIYNAVQLNNNYKALSLGIAANIGEFGALSVNTAYAKSKFQNWDSEGVSTSVLYSKSLMTTGMTVNLAGYRYSSKGYYDLSDVINEDNTNIRGNNKKARENITINQSLGKYGSLYTNYYKQTYWDGSKENNCMVGYNASIKNITFGLSYSNVKSDNKYSSNDKVISFNASMPIYYKDAKNSLSSSYVSYSADSNLSGDVSHRASFSGSLLEDKTLQYSASTRLNSGDFSGNVNLNYASRLAEYNIGYSKNKDSQSVNYSMKGGMILHEGGLTLGKNIGDTSMLVSTNGAANVPLFNQRNVVTDKKGYAIVSFARPYQENSIEIDVDKLDDNIEIAKSVKKVVPTDGAISKVSFDLKKGAKALINVKYQGKWLPFGSSVIDENDDQASIVGDEGKIYLSGLQEKQSYQIQWGRDKSCRLNIELNNLNEGRIYYGQADCI
ncbi:fimbria/pilus outer membrane usher protein [Photobacterium leiognathi]|uniref:fimbria/pilus outer membrane usher protein n=1 Tax=Photobacterium leiognathi TaxID=553611 RepID=UPI0027398F42|nr:fimbria/pilus outer membrane usher protein [Photobacterium leiognathi]